MSGQTQRGGRVNRGSDRGGRGRGDRGRGGGDGGYYRGGGRGGGGYNHGGGHGGGRGGGGYDRGGGGGGFDRGGGKRGPTRGGSGGRGSFDSRGPPAGPPIFEPAGPFIPPDQSVTNAEDAKVAQSASVNFSQLSVSEIPQPLRPGYSNIGKKIMLRTNYFPITPAKNLELYAYSLAITPQEQIKARRMRNRAAALYVNNAPFLQDPNMGVATDYGGTVITTKQLSFPGTEHVFQHAYYDEEEEGPLTA